MADSSVPVLICGAGPVGMSLATMLHRHDIAVRIIDKKSHRSTQSKAVGVHARTMEIFEDLGVIRSALEAGHRINGISVYSGKERIVHVTLDDLESPYPFVLDLPQDQTERILEEHLASVGIQIEWNTELVEFSEQEDGITAHLRKTDGSEETLTATYLAGTDGAHSTCRHALNAEFRGEAYAQHFMLADVQLDWRRPDDEFYVNLGSEQLVFIAPLNDNRYRVIVELPHSRTAKAEETELTGEPTLADLQRYCQGLLPEHTKAYDPVWLSYFKVHHRLVDRFQRGRVFLCGDAAHLHTPIGGQGMNLGIQDAYNLSWKLAGVLSGHARESLLESYHAERHPVAQEIVSGTDQAFRALTLQNPVAQGIRNRLAGFASSIDFVRHRMQRRLSMIAIEYRKSPIVEEHRQNPFSSTSLSEVFSGVLHWHDFGAAPNAGDRAVDAYVRPGDQMETVRLFELLAGPQHTLLLLAGGEPTGETYAKLVGLGEAVKTQLGDMVKVYLAATELPAGIPLPNDLQILVDHQHDLHHRYGARADSVYLIRPDGYVGFRSQPADVGSLVKYLQRLYKTI